MKILITILITGLLLSFSVASIFAEETGSPSAEMITTPKVEYEMVYPGILPDHKLYVFKAARDRIIAFFISNPVKKAEFDLLQTDKRVGASFLLIQKNEIDISESTFSKAMNYFEDGLNRLNDAKTQGVNISEFAKKFVTANQKYQEILTNIKKNIDNKNNKKFEVIQIRLIELGKRAKDLSK